MSILAMGPWTWEHTIFFSIAIALVFLSSAFFRTRSWTASMTLLGCGLGLIAGMVVSSGDWLENDHTNAMSLGCLLGALTGFLVGRIKSRTAKTVNPASADLTGYTLGTWIIALDDLALD